jgi:hypothetical protein
LLTPVDLVPTGNKGAHLNLKSVSLSEIWPFGLWFLAFVGQK